MTISPSLTRLTRRIALVALAASAAAPAWAQDNGLVTLPSRHPPRETLDRFEAAVRAAGWVVFTEIDHAAAAKAAGLELDPRIVVIFGNPPAGTPGMVEAPTLALDLPLRVLVWRDATGQTFVTRSSGADLAQRLFARHGVTIPPEGQAATEAFLSRLVQKAVE